MRRLGPALLALLLPLLVSGPSTDASPLSGPLAASTPPLGSRDVEAGRPFVRKYLPREYGGQEQNWAIAQDDRGVIYVGNNLGVLEYDGAAWRLIQVPNRTVVRSLVNDGHGRIYVGALGDFGYLAPDAAGRMQYVSLLPKVPAENRAFADVWRALLASDGIYFQSQQYLFRWAQGQMRVWKPASRFYRASVVDGTLYIGTPESGLLRLSGEELVEVGGGRQFVDEPRPVVLPFDSGRLLVGTRADGLYLSDGRTMTRFRTEIEPWLAAMDVYRGAALPDGSFALASSGGGMMIIDRQGRMLQHLDSKNGLSDSIYYIHADRQSGLWVGFEGGLARVETPSPVSLLDELSGLTGASVSFIHRHEGTLYVAASRGIFTLAPPSVPGSRPSFTRVKGIADAVQSWWLITVDDPVGHAPPTLLAATADGVYRIERDTALPIYVSRSATVSASVLRQSKVDPDRVFVGLFDGLASIKRKGSQWVPEGRIAGVGDEVRTIVEDDDGRLWLGTTAGGALRLTFRRGQGGAIDVTNPGVERFSGSHGLPAGAVGITSVGGRPLFGGVDEFFRFDARTTRFTVDKTFKVVSIDPRGIGTLATEDNHGDVWVNLGRESAVVRRQADGSYKTERTPFLRFAEFSTSIIYPDDDGVVWFGGRDGLLRYDPRVPKNYGAPFPVLIRRIAARNSNVLYAGSPGATKDAPKLAYRDNALRFEFAAPSFDDEASNRFQHYLEGLDQDWSEWSHETTADYTNLGPGTYRFHLRARNLYGQTGQEAVFPFTVLPPWYRTWWAYGAYAILLALGLLAVDRIQRHRVIGKERERARLTETQLRAEAAESLVRAEGERTKTIEQLSEIGKEITSSLDVDTIFARLYQRANQFADASIFGVGLYDPWKGLIEYRLAYHEGKRYEPYSRDVADKNQFAVWCLDNRKPVFINDVSVEYSRYLSEYHEAPRSLEDGTVSRTPASLIYLPLIRQGRVLGVITIQSFKKNAYTEYHLNLLQNLAAYTSIALDNANAYRQLDEQAEQIRQRVAELATIDNISRALASELELDSLIALVGDQVREVFKAQVAYLALLDKSTNTIHFRYGYGDTFPPLPFGVGMTSRIIQTGEPLLINEDMGGRTAALNITRSGIAAKSYLGVPIPVGNDVIGVLSVQSTEEEGRFSERDLRLLTTIAANVGVAIHNALLFEETKRARAAAEEADAAKSAFLSTVSHELRTPLTSVLGFAKIIKKRLEDRIFPLLTTDDRKIRQTIQQVGDNLNVVVSEGERLTKQIDDVLDLAKIEAGKLEWHMQTISMAAVVDRAASATSSLFEQKQLAFVRDVAEDLPPVMGDADRLLQVVINLISNAVKFTDRGSVTCRARLQDDGITVSVIDTGLGIAVADQPKVFEKFKQVGDTLTDKPKGTGLGLPICKEIVEHHGGRIWVESVLGCGSTFSFVLPMKIETAHRTGPVSLEVLVRQLSEPRAAGTLRTGGRQACILAVDDDPHILQLLSQEFVEAGYRVRTASNGREALAEIRQEPPDLVVLDVMMPEINGFDVAAVLKNDPRTLDIPIIILSIVEDRTRGFRLGVDRYLTKPIDVAALLRETKALLDQGASSKRVLVVDVEASAAKMLADVLQARGYNVTEVDSEGLVARAASMKPDIIVLNALLSERQDIVQALRFEKGLEHVLFLVYQ